MYDEVCPICNRNCFYLTRDHIVPVYLIKICSQLQIPIKDLISKKNSKIFGKYIKNIRMICTICNADRADKLFDHPLIDAVLDKMRHSGKVKIIIERDFPYFTIKIIYLHNS